MRKEEKAALDVLAKASDVHNCWAILDDAVTSGEDDGFTREYIEGEREMLEGSIKGTIRALGALGGFYGIAVSTQNDNGSYAYMRKVREEHLTELERAAEFDRGYRAGQRAMDAERQTIALKLRNLRGRGHVWNTELAVALGLDIHANNDCICERIIHLLGGDTCNCDQGGDHGDCAERRRTGAAGGDTDVDEPAEIRAVSNGIADMLRAELEEFRGQSRTCPESDEEMSESAPSVSIVDELRDCVERATKTYDDAAWYDVDDEDEHTWCSITVAEINGIADRIEEQFDRVCQQQETVLQATIEQMTDENLTVKDERDHLRRQMDQQRAMLTEQRDEARAKVIALCNECDKLKRAADRDADQIEALSAIVDDMTMERDNLLDLLRDAVVDFKNASYGWNYATVVSENITIETERNRLAKERDTLQKWLDDMREQREHWADEATKMYRLFFSHDEYCVPDNPSEMVAVAVRTLQDKLDKANGENKGLRLSIDEQKESIAQRKKTIKKLTRDNEKVWKTVHELQAKLDGIKSVLATDETEVSDAC